VKVSEGVAVRALKVLVVAMGVLIVGGTVTLVALLVQRAGGGGAGPAWQVALDQPEGTRIAGIAPAEGGIGIWVQRPDGDRILVVDPRRGRVGGEIRLGR
jgi:Flp pilus assembly protein protease CpaA